MQITLYGTRGSLPVSGKTMRRFGGNTTCLRIDSGCLPANHWLVVDAGTGIRPLGLDLLAAGTTAVTLLFTHYHHDHTMGLPFFAPLHSPTVRLDYYGPYELGFGPEELLRTIVQKPLFPVPFEVLQAQQHFYPLVKPVETVLAIHPKGGVEQYALGCFRQYEQRGPAQLPMGEGWYPIAECLIVTMMYSNHPDRTISYRFEERPTGKVFVFLTDHENTFAIEPALARHAGRADLLVMDCQYNGETYPKRVGYGHSTPEYCLKLARAAGVSRLALTHHDPDAEDVDIKGMLEEAVRLSISEPLKVDIFAAYDGQRVEL